MGIIEEYRNRRKAKAELPDLVLKIVSSLELPDREEFTARDIWKTIKDRKSGGIFTTQRAVRRVLDDQKIFDSNPGMPRSLPRESETLYRRKIPARTEPVGSR